MKHFVLDFALAIVPLAVTLSIVIAELLVHFVFETPEGIVLFLRYIAS